MRAVCSLGGLLPGINRRQTPDADWACAGQGPCRAAPSPHQTTPTSCRARHRIRHCRICAPPLRRHSASRDSQAMGDQAVQVPGRANENPALFRSDPRSRRACSLLRVCAQQGPEDRKASRHHPERHRHGPLLAVHGLSAPMASAIRARRRCSALLSFRVW